MGAIQRDIAPVYIYVDRLPIYISNVAEKNILILVEENPPPSS
jgi:hypothetical protein